MRSGGMPGADGKGERVRCDLGFLGCHGIDPVAVEVRARIKGYALYRAAMIGLPLDAIRTAHQTFLPEMEALAN